MSEFKEGDKIIIDKNQNSYFADTIIGVEGYISKINKFDDDACEIELTLKFGRGYPVQWCTTEYFHLLRKLETVEKPHIEKAKERLEELQEELQTEIKDMKAKRYNSSKAEFHLLPELAMAYVAMNGMFGGAKYPDDEEMQQNWRKGGNHSQYYNCRRRHELKYHYGQDLDIESKCHHLSCIIWNAAAELEVLLTGNLVDDRPKVNLTRPIDEILEQSEEQKEAMEKYRKKT